MLHHGLGVRMVIIEQVLARRVLGSPEVTKTLNDELERLATSGEYGYVKFWRHKAGLQDNVHRYLCRDGTHLNEHGMRKYWRSVRGALLWAASNLW